MKRMLGIVTDPTIILVAVILAAVVLATLNSCITVARDPAAFENREHR